MAENPGNPVGPGDSEHAADRPTAWPFMAALVLIVLVVIGVFLVNAFSGDGLSEEERVGRAAVGQNDAMQREDYSAFVGYTCAAQRGAEADFLARQRDSVQKQGARYVDDVTGVRIDGDRATATVVYHFEKEPDNKINVETVFVREDGEWRVCSSMGDSRP
ncbi:Rv0361 family membrane protein [Mycolicibacterium goodii]|uniref:Rv0361 family membrane protein n=1 Tax=Mycolicibacterium goodii TaxID=134601 RepID=UPI001BDD6F06|nr:lumazine-binding protein [Mycolicibacterium goodii]MBU8830270.1 lumazine-binding protein [Mycolicibacterium goodii]ULN48506.1 lumazine-binding protein [Mycolicibacterium goodii]